jgi:hypothetical protein
VLPEIQPAKLAKCLAAFDDAEWLFELKHDGFRSLAYLENALHGSECATEFAKSGFEAVVSGLLIGLYFHAYFLICFEARDILSQQEKSSSYSVRPAKLERVEHIPNGTSSKPRKDLAPYQDLGRGPLSSYYRRVATAAAPVTDPPKNFFSRLASFGKGNWYAWFSHAIRYARSPRHTFETYEQGGGVYEVAERFSLGIAGDWGTGTDEAHQVVEKMVSHDPDYTIHLGDVYYVGDRPDLEVNCLGFSSARHEGVKWKQGRLGSFALNGNDEMYACGDAYFNDFLPTLGVKVQGQTSGQKASFFCLQNKYWRIIGLDTGYNSAGLVMTFLNSLSKIKWIKWFRKVPYFKPSSALEAKLLDWLRGVVKDNPDGTRPATVLLSHHQYYSGFDDWYRIPGQQLSPFYEGQKVVWFWGHEHRFALYDHFQIKGGIDAYGRCLGHGGMPVDRGHAPDVTDCKCIFYDNRRYDNDEHIDVGYNGFAALQFDGPKLCVNYYDLQDTLLLTEEWTTDARGILSGPRFSNIYEHLNRHDPSYVTKHS